VAYDWAERGIDNADDAEEYISLFNNEYREILRFYGVSGRDPISKEIEFMHGWVKKDGFAMDVIKLACERTIMSKAKANFAYTDGILQKWLKDKIHTVEQIQNLEKTYYDNIKATRRTADKDKQSKPKARFQNYQGREWDYEKMAKMNREYLERKVAE